MSTVPGKSLYILYIVTEETWISSGVMYISDVSKSTENWEGLPNIIWATNANHIYNFKFSKSHNEKKKKRKTGSLVAQGVKDLALSRPWHGFNPWAQEILHAVPVSKKKKKKK